VILQDDYDAEYRYDRRPVGVLQGLDPARVAYLGSVSKTLGPGVRLGWAVAPGPLLAAVLKLRATLDQLTLAQLIETGSLDRHLRRTRAVYVTRRNALRASLAGLFPGSGVEGVEAGLHLLAGLPPTPARLRWSPRPAAWACTSPAWPTITTTWTPAALAW
jgi:GntR family transcriptional regulator / MocR family aminotransferase